MKLQTPKLALNLPVKQVDPESLISPKRVIMAVVTKPQSLTLHHPWLIGTRFILIRYGEAAA